MRMKKKKMRNKKSKRKKKRNNQTEQLRKEIKSLSSWTLHLHTERDAHSFVPFSLAVFILRTHYPLDVYFVVRLGYASLV